MRSASSGVGAELPLIEGARRVGQLGPRRQCAIDPCQGVVVGAIRGFERPLPSRELVRADAGGHAEGRRTVG
jgi:hypothetical protein